MPDSPLPACIQQLVDTIRQHEQLTPSLARHLLAASEITADDLLPWSTFDHPKQDSYGRKLVDGGGYFELMVMSWVDGDMSAIHDHGHTQWGAVKLFGPANHALFQIRHGQLTTLSRTVCSPGTVVAVDHHMIHQMGNVGHPPFLTLHLYGADVFDGAVTADARLYELDEGTIQFTSGGVFFDLPEDKINRREPAPSADFPTTLRHKVELCNRHMQMYPDYAERGSISRRANRLVQEQFSLSFWEPLYTELEQMKSQGEKTYECYRTILHQELASAAKLQQRVVDAGLIEPASTLPAVIIQNRISEDSWHLLATV